jgi:hypothetical protein
VAVKRTTTKSTTKAPAARKPSIRRKRTPAATPEEIATRAYYLHLDGGPDPLENWLRAERELIPA